MMMMMMMHLNLTSDLNLAAESAIGSHLLLVLRSGRHSKTYFGRPQQPGKVRLGSARRDVETLFLGHFLGESKRARFV